jgi:hypothetical protein
MLLFGPPQCTGFVKDAAINEWGHAVLATALSVVDDSSLLNKVIIAELKVRDTGVLDSGWAGRGSMSCIAFTPTPAVPAPVAI